MDDKMIKELIENGRNFMKFSKEKEFSDYKSDQMLKKTQPPLTKKIKSEEIIELPTDFENLNIEGDFTSILFQRKSSRVYTEEVMTLLELSYLLWATQGIKDIRGHSYATLRTVPSGGARHGFETYLAIQNIQGLHQGMYHYNAKNHELALIKKVDDFNTLIGDSLVGQSWANKSNVVFYWSIVAYRCEWRYGIHAHRVALIDAGHVGQNLYLACSALKLGTCAIAAFDNATCNEMFHLDGQEEFIVYSAPVGKISEKDSASEKAFYKFVEEDNL